MRHFYDHSKNVWLLSLPKFIPCSRASSHCAIRLSFLRHPRHFTLPSLCLSIRYFSSSPSTARVWERRTCFSSIPSAVYLFIFDLSALSRFRLRRPPALLRWEANSSGCMFPISSFSRDFVPHFPIPFVLAELEYYVYLRIHIQAEKN